MKTIILICLIAMGCFSCGDTDINGNQWCTPGTMKCDGGGAMLCVEDRNPPTIPRSDDGHWQLQDNCGGRQMQCSTNPGLCGGGGGSQKACCTY